MTDLSDEIRACKLADAIGWTGGQHERKRRVRLILPAFAAVRAEGVREGLEKAASYLREWEYQMRGTRFNADAVALERLAEEKGGE